MVLQRYVNISNYPNIAPQYRLFDLYDCDVKVGLWSSVRVILRAKFVGSLFFITFAAHRRSIAATQVGEESPSNIRHHAS